MKRLSNLKIKYSKRKYNSKKIRGGKPKPPKKDKNDRDKQGAARSQFNYSYEQLKAMEIDALRDKYHKIYSAIINEDKNFPQKDKKHKNYDKNQFIQEIQRLQKKFKDIKSSSTTTATATTTTSQPATQTTSKGSKSNSSGTSSSEGKTQGKTIAPRLKWIIQNMPILYNGLDINCKYDKSLYTNVEEIERKMRSMHSTIQKGILSEECRELSRQRGSRESRSRGRYNISNNSNSL